MIGLLSLNSTTTYSMRRVGIEPTTYWLRQPIVTRAVSRFPLYARAGLHPEKLTSSARKPNRSGNRTAIAGSLSSRLAAREDAAS